MDAVTRLVFGRLLRRLVRIGSLTVVLPSGETLQAGDGDAALQLALQESPDLIVLDLAMPVRSGVDVLPELHERVPEAQIVVVSNFPRRRMAAIVRERGAVGYVEKRTRADRLVEEIFVAAAMAERAAHRGRRT